MVKLEKVTYKPLIEHLQLQEGYYNALLSQFEIKHGTIPGDLISYWVVQTVQPIIETLALGDEAKVARVSRAFFQEIINLSGSGNLQLYSDEYEKVWGLLFHIPIIFSQKPGRVLSILNEALTSIRKYQPKKVIQWINLLEATAKECDTLEMFISLGRVTAWMCGMSHLRERVMFDYQQLPDKLQSILEDHLLINRSIKECLSEPWGTDPFYSEKLVGGFVGFNYGIFLKPPRIAAIQDVIVATDGVASCAIFADRCGAVALTAVNILPEQVIENIGLRDERKSIKVLNLKYSDISSLITINNSVVFTRDSSHYVYIESLV